MALDRGKILEQRVYNPSNTLLKHTKFEYDESVDREREAVRSIASFSRTFPRDRLSAYVDARITAYLIFTFPRLLIKQTDSLFDVNGLNPITTVNEFTYDRSFRQKIDSRTVGSDLKKIKTRYIYPYDMVSQNRDPNKIYDEMVKRNLINPVIEQEQLVDEALQEKSITNYTKQNTTDPYLILPQNTATQYKNETPEIRLRYKAYDNKGNLLSMAQENGLISSFQWGYNQMYPVVKIDNAENTVITELAEEELSTYASMDKEPSKKITTSVRGDIRLNVDGEPGQTFSLRYSLTGPVTKEGILCVSRSTTTCNYPSSITFPDMPAGDYTLNIANEAGPTSNKRMTIRYSVRRTISKGVKEFFYENFEEDPTAMIGKGHTGTKYNNGAYTVNWTKPNDRNYVVSYWYLDDKGWKYSGLKAYTGTSFVLTGGTAYDDVCIRPSDTHITTYTYDPPTGVSSMTDAKGNTTTYEYDGFQRLKLVKDQEGNIIKSMNYNYKH